MSEAANRAAPRPNWNAALLVAVLCAAASFCAGFFLQTKTLDLLHHAHSKPDTFQSAVKAFMLMFFAGTAGGMIAAAVASSLGAWAYLKHTQQLPG